MQYIQNLLQQQSTSTTLYNLLPQQPTSEAQDGQDGGELDHD